MQSDTLTTLMFQCNQLSILKPMISRISIPHSKDFVLKISMVHLRLFVLLAISVHFVHMGLVVQRLGNAICFCAKQTMIIIPIWCSALSIL